jgi:hypothetical protein
MEPWDGPANIAFTDGKSIGAGDLFAQLERRLRRVGDWVGAYRLLRLRAELATARGESSDPWLERSAVECDRVTRGLAETRALHLRGDGDGG